MALRIVEVQMAAGCQSIAEEVLREAGAGDIWAEPGRGYEESVRAVIGSERTGVALDRLHEHLSSRGAFRILVMPLDAALPRPMSSQTGEGRERAETFAAVSREEIYAAVQEGTRLTPHYALLVLLATAVAAIGLVRDNTAAVIGAMVVAPLLGPNMGIALAFSLGDRQLLRDAIRASGTGVSLAFATSMALGWLMTFDPSVPEIVSRTDVALSDMFLALAAGAAGTLAYTSGAPTYLVGVMVAVALLPPTVASGLLAGAGHLREAYEAGLLVATNVAAVTLAAMVTFRVTGMRPRHWWRAEQAKTSARLGLFVFLVLGALLAALVVLGQAGVEAVR